MEERPLILEITHRSCSCSIASRSLPCPACQTSRFSSSPYARVLVAPVLYGSDNFRHNSVQLFLNAVMLVLFSRVFDILTACSYLSRRSHAHHNSMSD